MIAICPAGPPKLMKPSLSQKPSASPKEMFLFIVSGRRYSFTYGGDGGRVAARIPARFRAVAYRFAEPRGELERRAPGNAARLAARRGARRQALRRAPRGDRRLERPDGTAARGGRAAGLSPSIARRAARRARAPLHAGRHGGGADA